MIAIIAIFVIVAIALLIDHVEERAWRKSMRRRYGNLKCLR